MLRILQASAWTDDGDASCTYTGTWSTPSPSGVTAKGGTFHLSTTVGDKVTITGYASTEITIMFLALSVAETTLDGSLTVSVGGTTYGTLPSMRVCGMNAGAWQTSGFKVTGMPSGSKSVDVTFTGKTSNWGLYFDGYLSPRQSNPPAVVLVKDVPMTVNWTWGGGNWGLAAGNAQLATLNSDLDTIAAESEWGGTNYVRVADPNAYGWDSTTGVCIANDNIHPSALGATLYLNAIEAQARQFTPRLGII